MYQVVSESHSMLNDKLKDATEPKVFGKLSNPDKQQLCWQCLLYMKDRYRDIQNKELYTYAYFNMAKFLLSTGVYPDKVFSKERSSNKSKLFHSRLVTKMAGIVVESSKDKGRIFKWSRIYMSALAMDYADKHEKKPSSKQKQLSQSYTRLLEARQVNSTKTVNFYLAKLILDPKFRYIPQGTDQEAADLFARQCLSEMLERPERQSRVSGARSDGSREKPPLYPIRSAQPVYLHRGRTPASVSEELLRRSGQPFLSIASSAASMDLGIEDERIQESSNEEEGSAASYVDLGLPPSIPLISADSSMGLDSMVKEQEDGSEFSASLSSSSALSSLGVKDESSSRDESSSGDEEGKESKVFASSKSLLTPSSEIFSGSESLKEALGEAIKAEQITEKLKQELAKRYPSPKNSTRKTIEVARLVLGIRECEGLSHKGIAVHVLLKGKIPHSDVTKILNENGIIKSAVRLTDQRKQELLVHYVAIKAGLEKDAQVALQKIARAIAGGLNYKETEVITALETLMDRRSQKEDNPNDEQKDKVCRLYKEGMDYPNIKKETNLSFRQITQIILDKIPQKELTKGSSITLPEGTDRKKRSEAIVASFNRLKQETGSSPTATQVERATGHSEKICLQVLKAAGLISGRTASKHLDQPTQENIKEFWKAQTPKWDREGDKGKSLKGRLEETAVKFRATKNQVRTLCAPPPSKRKPDKQSASGLKGKKTSIKDASKRRKT